MNTEDSLEKIKEDADKSIGQYWNCENVYLCKNCPSKISGKTPYKYYGTLTCDEAIILNLIDRTIEVMKGNIERTCRPIAKPNVWGFCDFYCECGNKLLEVANGMDEYLPNYCSNCGAKVVE